MASQDELDAIARLSIADEQQLWRRIPNRPSYVIYDENLGRPRPTSLAFDDPRMSVTIDEGRTTLAQLLIGHDGFFVASLETGFVRALGQVLERKPLSHDLSHAEVVGNKTRSICSRMAKTAGWVVAPP